MLEDVIGRITRREVNDIRRAVHKYLVRGQDEQAFLSWLRKFYEEHASFIERNMRPPIETIAQLVLGQVADELGDADLALRDEDMSDEVQTYAQNLSIRWSASGRNQVEEILRETEEQERVAALEERLDRWNEEQPRRVGRRESVRIVNAMARGAYLIGGVTLFRWHSIGESCPYCESLDGRVVGRDEPFLAGGSEFHPDGAESPLRVRRSVWYGPAHDGCDCVVTAA